MWSMGNEEGQANTDKGVLILGAMKALAIELTARARPFDVLQAPSERADWRSATSSATTTWILARRLFTRPILTSL